MNETTASSSSFVTAFDLQSGNPLGTRAVGKIKDQLPPQPVLGVLNAARMSCLEHLQLPLVGLQSDETSATSVQIEFRTSQQQLKEEGAVFALARGSILGSSERGKLILKFIESTSKLFSTVTTTISLRPPNSQLLIDELLSYCSNTKPLPLWVSVCGPEIALFDSKLIGSKIHSVLSKIVSSTELSIACLFNTNDSEYPMILATTNDWKNEISSSNSSLLLHFVSRTQQQQQQQQQSNTVIKINSKQYFIINYSVGSISFLALSSQQVTSFENIKSITEKFITQQLISLINQSIASKEEQKSRILKKIHQQQQEDFKKELPPIAFGLSAFLIIHSKEEQHENEYFLWETNSRRLQHRDNLASFYEGCLDILTPSGENDDNVSHIQAKSQDQRKLICVSKNQLFQQQQQPSSSKGKNKNQLLTIVAISEQLPNTHIQTQEEEELESESNAHWMNCFSEAFSKEIVFPI